MHCAFLIMHCLVVPGRVELPTSTLSVWRSNQLSYRTLFRFRSSLRGFCPASFFSLFQKTDAAYKKTGYKIRLLKKQEPKVKSLQRSHDPSPERRCSSRTFRYGYLVTT